MIAAFSNGRVLSLLLFLDLFCLSVAIGDHRAASADDACSLRERRPELRTTPQREAIAMLGDMRLHD